MKLFQHLGKKIKKFIQSITASTLIAGLMLGLLYLAPNDPRLHAVAIMALVLYSTAIPLLIILFVASSSNLLSKMTSYEEHLAGAFIKDFDESKMSKTRNKLYSDYELLGILQTIAICYSVLLSFGVCAVAAMNGYMKTAIWLGWSEIWWLIGLIMLRGAQKIAFTIKPQVQVQDTKAIEAEVVKW